MDTARNLTVVGALVLACLPLGSDQRAPDFSAATPSNSAKVMPLPDRQTKSPVDPKEALPNPFTSAEAEANRTSQAIGALVSGLEGFAGLWVDGCGMVHVASQLDAVDEFHSILNSQYAGRYELAIVEFSYQDLLARRDVISTRVVELNDLGLELMDWGPDESQNTVRVSLADYSDAKAELVRKLLGQDILVSPSEVRGGAGDLFSLNVQDK